MLRSLLVRSSIASTSLVTLIRVVRYVFGANRRNHLLYWSTEAGDCLPSIAGLSRLTWIRSSIKGHLTTIPPPAGLPLFGGGG